eukprot:3867976-Prymnesium_polylepis.1
MSLIIAGTATISPFSGFALQMDPGDLTKYSASVIEDFLVRCDTNLAPRNSSTLQGWLNCVMHLEKGDCAMEYHHRVNDLGAQLGKKE